ncbi:MAG: sigma 54-interacting transcriptional regulator [Firmicutes bacterium]|nr:sigma 54-interacting transcriptional regulator [Bacillota bacterium]
MAGRPGSGSPPKEVLQAIYDSFINGIVVIDRNGTISAFNRAAETLTGVRAEDALGKPIAQVIPNNGLLRVLEHGHAEVAQTMNLGDNTVMVNRAPVFKHGRIDGAVAVFQDINDLRPLADELASVKASLETLETIVDNAWDWIVVVDRDGIITMINDAYCEFLGVTKEQATGTHVTKIIENTRMHIVAQTGVAEIGHAQKIKGQEMICMRVPIKKDGRVIGAVGKSMFKDVGELRQLAQRLRILEGKVAYYERELPGIRSPRHTMDDIVGSSPTGREVKELIQKAARQSSNVLLTGETGTGKELAAHAIHALSPRAQGPFIRVNCAAIPRDLLESELFGYETGAFTGASRGGKPGRFELAAGGTIFLDE